MSQTRLSVNINKVALIRNSRGSNLPNLIKVAKDCEEFGAQGITVHPRPDERHVKQSDIWPLKKNVTTEFNIEGYPTDNFVKMVCDVKPAQVTLVPDLPGQLTSDHGWDCKSHQNQLKDLADKFHDQGIRVSVFLDPSKDQVKYCKDTGVDRLEFYTGPFAKQFAEGEKEKSIIQYTEAALLANELELGINAGHDLNLNNLQFFCRNIPQLLEVSIGHALISDALYLGLHNTIQAYLLEIDKGNV